MPLLGAHQSAAGGLHSAFGRIREVGGEALQIFTANQRQWKTPSVSPEQARAFREAWREWGPYPVASHDSYLINPASPDRILADRSVAALTLELERCHALGIAFLVLHPGAHKGEGADQGLTRAARRIDQALSRAPGETRILLENTAGQGTALGAEFSDLAAIIERSEHPERLGVCLDTCHAFAAGMDLAAPGGVKRCLERLESEVSLDRLCWVHLNDAKGAAGSHLDRHAHIGEGSIGLDAFAELLNHPAMTQMPMTLETPKSKDLSEDVRNLTVLRGLLRSS